MGSGQIWRRNQTDQSGRLQVSANPHSPGKYRVNGVVQNMPEFESPFQCRQGQPMVSAEPCRAW